MRYNCTKDGCDISTVNLITYIMHLLGSHGTKHLNMEKCPCGFTGPMITHLMQQDNIAEHIEQGECDMATKELANSADVDHLNSIAHIGENLPRWANERHGEW